MSQGQFCSCGRVLRTDKEDLVVMALKCNHSAFNGYHYTPSDWSHVRCLRPGCYGSWRTKSNYVYELPDCTGDMEKLNRCQMEVDARFQQEGAAT